MNLHALALQIVRENGSPDPDVLAADLVAKIKPGDRREALAVMAHGYICDVIRSQRPSVMGATFAGARGSSKIRAAAEAWTRLLDGREFVPSLGAWVHLRDATRDQVLEMAGERRGKARENDAAADRYEAVAASMKAQKAMRVGDLDETLLRDVLGPEGRAA